MNSMTHTNLKARLYDLTDERDKFRNETDRLEHTIKGLEEQLEEARGDVMLYKNIAEKRADTIKEMMIEKRSGVSVEQFKHLENKVRKAFSEVDSLGTDIF